MKRKRVVVVDPSNFFRSSMQHLLEADPRFQFAGSTGHGGELLEQLMFWRPDVVLLALELADMDGLNLLEVIMLRFPTAVVVVDKLSGEARSRSVDALHCGALDVIDKNGLELADYESLQTGILERVATLVEEAPNVANLSEPHGLPAVSPTTSSLFRKIERHLSREPYEIIAIGASTGGPSAIQAVLDAIGTALCVPVVVVQHMPSGFTRAFAARLDEHLEVEVKEASEGDVLQEGVVYVAPAGSHMRVRRLESGDFVSELGQEPADVSHRPSVNVLFASLAENPEAAVRTIAVLLTGMGNDGAAGLKLLEKSGSHTIVQDKSTCVVYGMPAAAIELGAACEVLPLPFVGERLVELMLSRLRR